MTSWHIQWGLYLPIQHVRTLLNEFLNTQPTSMQKVNDTRQLLRLSRPNIRLVIHICPVKTSIICWSDSNVSDYLPSSSHVDTAVASVVQVPSWWILQWHLIASITKDKLTWRMAWRLPDEEREKQGTAWWHSHHRDSLKPHSDQADGSCTLFIHMKDLGSHLSSTNVWTYGKMTKE